MTRPLRAWVEVELCRCCAAARVVCPRCGDDWELRCPLPLPRFPARVADTCDATTGCGLELLLEVVGWGPPLPATDQPPPPRPADLSDRARLETIWQQPPAPRPGHPLLASVPAVSAGSPPARQAPTRRGPPPPPPRPCPADAERHRLAIWARRGWLPEGVAPSAIAAAYRRRFDAEPPRDAHHRQSRAYSLRELGLALQELGLRLSELGAIWDLALQELELPSTRMLLLQHARLADLREGPESPLAVVLVNEPWLAMVQSRAQLLSAAFADALGCPVVLQLQGVEQ